MEKFILLLRAFLLFKSSVLTVMVFYSALSFTLFSAEFLTSVLIGLTALFSLEPKSPNLFFLMVGEVASC
jgi:hypothetical protein